jgi:hypothetical protein
LCVSYSLLSDMPSTIQHANWILYERRAGISRRKITRATENMALPSSEVTWMEYLIYSTWYPMATSLSDRKSILNKRYANTARWRFNHRAVSLNSIRKN